MIGFQTSYDVPKSCLHVLILNSDLWLAERKFPLSADECEIILHMDILHSAQCIKALLFDYGHFMFLPLVLCLGVLCVLCLQANTHRLVFKWI